MTTIWRSVHHNEWGWGSNAVRWGVEEQPVWVFAALVQPHWCNKNAYLCIHIHT